MSGDSQKLLELAERAEKAEGPDRELDGDIAAALALHPAGWYRGVKAASAEAMWFKESARDSWRSPDFTASLDAALALVPEDRDWHIGRLRHDKAKAVLVLQDAGEHEPTQFAYAATPALALCAAALRARAAAIEPPVCECNNAEVDGCPLHWK